MSGSSSSAGGAAPPPTQTPPDAVGDGETPSSAYPAYCKSVAFACRLVASACRLVFTISMATGPSSPSPPALSCWLFRCRPTTKHQHPPASTKSTTRTTTTATTVLVALCLWFVVAGDPPGAPVVAVVGIVVVVYLHSYTSAAHAKLVELSHASASGSHLAFTPSQVVVVDEVVLAVPVVVGQSPKRSSISL